MALPNLPRTPQGSHISRVQRSTPQPPQNLQYNREQWPSQISPRPQNMNNLLRPYYAPNLMPSDWPSNQYVGHSNPNSLLHHPPMIGPYSPIIEALQPLSAQITGGGSGQHLPRSADRSSEYMYLGLHNNGNIHSIDSNVSIPGPWTILPDSQMSTAESHNEQDPSLYNPHELNGGELPIDAVNPAPHNSSNDSNRFRSLPGYHGNKNSYRRFDCFDNCRFRRFGRRGFLRRGNMLVHLRSCHNQNIPRGRGAVDFI